MPNRVAVGLVAALALGAGGYWGSTQMPSANAASDETVTVRLGQVAQTVGGIGHVATLTEAARLAVSQPDGGSGRGGATVSSTGSAGASAGISEAVFGTVSGSVRRLYVGVGDRVTAGQPIARLADDGTRRAAIVQADYDLAAARLDLAQKRVQDPARGLPPTPAEMISGRQALVAAQARLARLTGPPLPSDLAAARLEVDRATAELEAEQSAASGRPDALAAAQLAVATANQRLALLTGAPDPAEVAAARLEVARAQVEQETLLQPPASASAADVAAADAAVVAAQEKVAAAVAAGVTADLAAAQAELAKARAERDVLGRAPAAPTAAAQSAAQLAVDTAKAKLDQLLHPPAATVTAARGELSKAQADLAALLTAGSPKRIAAARSAITAAQSRLDLILDPPTEIVAGTRAEVARADADLSVLRQRGAPASKTDIAIAGLRVNLAQQQVRLARELAGRLTVRAPATGTVTSVLTADGAAVDPTAPLVRVQDLDNLVVSVNLTEFDVSRIRVGAPARIRADALGGRAFTGQVTDVALSGNESGGVVTFPVIVSIDEAEGLRPGMSISVRVVVASRVGVVLLPLDAIQDREGRRATISVRTRAGEVETRRVTLGLVGATHAEVRAGLAAGEKVVIPVDEDA